MVALVFYNNMFNQRQFSLKLLAGVFRIKLNNLSEGRNCATKVDTLWKYGYAISSFG